MFPFSYSETSGLVLVLEESGEDTLEPVPTRRVCVVGTMPSHGATVLNALVSACDHVVALGLPMLRQINLSYCSCHFRSFQNRMNCEVVYSESGAEYLNQLETVTFLCWSFETAEFRALCDKGAKILGPTLVKQWSGDRVLPLVEKGRPCYSQCMHGLRFSLSGYGPAEVKKYVDLIHYMKGSARQKFSDKDVLIANSVLCTKYQAGLYPFLALVFRKLLVDSSSNAR